MCLSRFLIKKILCPTLLTALLGTASAQELLLPTQSQRAVVTQFIGLAELRVYYSRPAAEGKEPFGSVVIDGNMWQGGENEQTRVLLTEEALVEGKKLKSGEYTLHFIVSGNTCTVVFNMLNGSVGNDFVYKQEYDALRLNVEMRAAPFFREYLSYDFENISGRSAQLVLNWGSKAIPLLVEFNEHDIVLEKIHNEYLNGKAEYNWETWYEAARYCADQNINHQEAIQWIQNSIAKEENFHNYFIKSKLFEQIGDMSGSRIALKKALKFAEEKDVIKYAETLLDSQKPAEAMQAFHKTVKASRFDGVLFEALADAYLKSGDKKTAAKYYQKAIKKTDEASVKEKLQSKLEQTGE